MMSDMGGYEDMTVDVMRIFDDVIPELHGRIQTELTEAEWSAIATAITKTAVRTARLTAAMCHVPMITTSDMTGSGEFDSYRERGFEEDD